MARSSGRVRGLLQSTLARLHRPSAEEARDWGWTDAQGNKVILREGSNGLTCMPGNPNVVGDPPMCADAASMQWASDFSAHKRKPTNSIPEIAYMLAGATHRSDSDPYDKTSPPITVGPHWMVICRSIASGLPTTLRDTGAYVMWAGSPYAHLHVMGRP